MITKQSQQGKVSQTVGNHNKRSEEDKSRSIVSAVTFLFSVTATFLGLKSEPRMSITSGGATVRQSLMIHDAAYRLFVPSVFACYDYPNF